MSGGVGFNLGIGGHLESGNRRSFVRFILAIADHLQSGNRRPLVNGAVDKVGLGLLFGNDGIGSAVLVKHYCRDGVIRESIFR